MVRTLRRGERFRDESRTLLHGQRDAVGGDGGVPRVRERRADAHGAARGVEGEAVDRAPPSGFVPVPSRPAFARSPSGVVPLLLRFLRLEADAEDADEGDALRLVQGSVGDEPPPDVRLDLGGADGRGGSERDDRDGARARRARLRLRRRPAVRREAAAAPRGAIVLVRSRGALAPLAQPLAPGRVGVRGALLDVPHELVGVPLAPLLDARARPRVRHRHRGRDADVGAGQRRVPRGIPRELPRRGGRGRAPPRGPLTRERHEARRKDAARELSCVPAHRRARPLCPPGATTPAVFSHGPRVSAPRAARRRSRQK